MTTSPPSTAGPASESSSGADDQAELARLSQLTQRSMSEVKRVIVGQEHMVEQLMVALIAGGHVLLEGVPGTAKTLAVRTFADVVGGTFTRIQFTPDLVPSDIVGTRIYRPSKESFDVELGPVFVNFVIADEINRAPAKVQSAMLELMAEHQVSIGGQTFRLPDPFIVIATQNPIESEGVYPLPEAQRDRFLFKVDIQHPRGQEEFEILRRMSVDPPRASGVLDPETILELRSGSRPGLPAQPRLGVHRPTRAGDPLAGGVPPARPRGRDRDRGVVACDPRARRAARAIALIHGRNYVLPQDVAVVARDVMAHRLVLSFDAVADEVDPGLIVDRIVNSIPPPQAVWNNSARPEFR